MAPDTEALFYPRPEIRGITVRAGSVSDGFPPVRRPAYFPNRMQETKKSKTMIMKRTKSKIRSRTTIAGSRFLTSDPTLTLNSCS